MRNFIDQHVSFKRSLSRAVQIFNAQGFKASRLFLLSEGRISAGDNEAGDIAAFLLIAKGLDKKGLGNVLGEHNPLALQVLREFVRSFDFAQMRIDQAMRVLIETFWLPGEAQKIVRRHHHC